MQFHRPIAMPLFALVAQLVSATNSNKITVRGPTTEGAVYFFANDKSSDCRWQFTTVFEWDAGVKKPDLEIETVLVNHGGDLKNRALLHWQEETLPLSYSDDGLYIDISVRAVTTADGHQCPEMHPRYKYSLSSDPQAGTQSLVIDSNERGATGLDCPSCRLAGLVPRTDQPRTKQLVSRRPDYEKITVNGPVTDWVAYFYAQDEASDCKWEFTTQFTWSATAIEPEFTKVEHVRITHGSTAEASVDWDNEKVPIGYTDSLYIDIGLHAVDVGGHQCPEMHPRYKFMLSSNHEAGTRSVVIDGYERGATGVNCPSCPPG